MNEASSIPDRRHDWRDLSEDEHAAIQKLKDLGTAMHELFDGLGTSRELSIAKTRIEEAVMWGTRHIIS